MAPLTKEQVLRSMRRMHKRYIRMCARRNVYWELTVEQFHKLTSQNCKYCSRPPMQVYSNYTYNGIDRLNPKRGYILDNCVPCCKECNWIKGDRLTPDEMMVVGEALSTYRQRRKN